MIQRIRQLTCHYDPDTVIARLRQVKLKGHGEFPIWRDCNIDVVALRKDQIFPTQKYILRSRLEEIRALRGLLQRCLVVIPPFLEVSGWSNGSLVHFPLTFPIVENDPELEPGQYVLVDGMHRVMERIHWSSAVQCIRILNPHIGRFPYYAKPLAGWNEVQITTVKPSGAANKDYREPGDHKALFRMLNAEFEGIQEERK